MYIIRGTKNVPPGYRGGVATIGNFDGVHLGHQAIFRRLRELAAPHGAPCVAVTFEPHPRRLLHPERTPARITGVRGKSRWMDHHGIDAMFILQFTHSLAALEPEAFVQRFLVDALAVKEVLVGFNFRFGAGGKGGMETLQRLGERYGFGAHQQPPFLLDGEAVSSTRIRNAVRGCDFAAAQRLLGRPFEIEARVGAGHKRGRGLGFPTANLALTCVLHPPPGVYVVEGWVDGAWLPAVANVGNNPTFGDAELHLEAHMLVPCGDLYRRVMRIRFLKHLRPERKFPDAAALKAQIIRDVAEAQAFFAARERVSGV